MVYINVSRVFVKFFSSTLIWHDYSSLLVACEDDSQSDIVSMSHTLLEDNIRLRDLATLLQGRHHKMSMEV